jgi:aspartyl-tRNA(Asn)/glutamyl-tRNA(Gln) amidotransferase subunit B
VRYLGISDGNMQEGSFRCDANISVRPKGQQELGTRTELKNLNSFRFVEKAIDFEIERQVEVLEDGGEVVQETRLYDAERDETRAMRGKEEANDYRYFPDPDLLPVELDEGFITGVREAMPELPRAKAERFTADYGLKQADIDLLTASRDTADYFEAVAASVEDKRLAANWVAGELGAALNRDGLDITASKVSAASLAGLLNRIHDNTISGKIAKEVFAAMWDEGGEADAIIESRGLEQITDSGELEAMVDQVIADNPEQVEQYRAGKEKVLGFLVGQVMKATQGKANPAKVNEILRAKLGS